MLQRCLSIAGPALAALACSSLTIAVDPTAPPPATIQPRPAPTVSVTLAPSVPAATPGSVPTLGAPIVSAGSAIGGCPIFPPDHIWNTPVDALPVHPRSEAYINSIGRDVGLHPDFGAGEWEAGPIGIPYTTADAHTPRVPVSFAYADESDPGPYPIPDDPPIEGGPASSGDRHILIVETGECKLYELYAAYPGSDGSWQAGSGAIWDLRGYALRPAGWTSADAAGLPILAGLVRYDEVASGEIRHAIRFTAEQTQAAYVWPARHLASDIVSPDVPPMGQRFRLKASVDLAGYPAELQVILRAMQVYGLILADNGSNWYISGAPDPRWNDETLVPLLREITGENFEAVDARALMLDPASGQARQP